MTEPSIPSHSSRQILVRRIRSGSLLALIFVGVAGFVLPAFLLFGVLALFGANTVRVGGEPVTGFMGLVAAVTMAPIFTLLISLFAWVGGYFSIRVWGHFKPIKLEYVPGD